MHFFLYYWNEIGISLVGTMNDVDVFAVSIFYSAVIFEDDVNEFFGEGIHYKYFNICIKIFFNINICSKIFLINF